MQESQRRKKKKTNKQKNSENSTVYASKSRGEGKENFQEVREGEKGYFFPSSLFINMLSPYSNSALVLVLCPKAMVPHYLAKVYLFPATHKTS